MAADKKPGLKEKQEQVTEAVGGSNNGNSNTPERRVVAAEWDQNIRKNHLWRSLTNSTFSHFGARKMARSMVTQLRM